jgi:perosamine synthetase
MRFQNDFIPHSRPTLGGEEELEVSKIIRSCQIAQGPKVEKFEKIVADYIGREYAIAVSSGLSALHLALKALDIKENEEVMIPSYTCDALLLAVSYLNAKPIIIDSNYVDGNISFEKCLELKSDNSRAIILPHNYGFAADLEKFMTLDIPIIEDCAVAIGGSFKGKKLGAFGKISAFSFYATKMITTGEGGMLLTDDADIAKELRELRDYSKNVSAKMRYNYKMTDIEAGVGICQMRKLDNFVTRRNEIYEYYSKMLRDRHDVITPYYDKETILPSFYRYVLKIPNKIRSELLKNMLNKGVACSIGVPKPLHKLLGLADHKYSGAEKLYKEAFSLPIYPSLQNSDIEYIIHEFITELNDLN